FGGAIRNFDGIIRITNSTLANNSASTFGGGISLSGAGGIVIAASTFVDNTAPDGGAIYITGGTTTLSTSIISGTGTQCAILGGVLTADVTTITDNVCDNALVVADLMLAAFNGQIVPILTGSPAINAYSAPCVVSSDQIGTSRPQLGACDSGAVESLSVTFNEQSLLAQLQIESLALGAVSYPLVLDIIPTNMTITFSDNTGAIGTAQVSLILEN
ncbi:MAG TPA: choice-of-anchor Q domain-containing protein, partial [Aggregatilineales bacterium]|nr:choice-of-anchor Q domain-containing protein [Aggregatilineales bacterium]